MLLHCYKQVVRVLRCGCCCCCCCYCTYPAHITLLAKDLQMVRDGYLLTAASSIPIEGRNTKSHCKYHLLAPPIPFDLLHPLTLPSAVETHRVRSWPRCWTGFYSNASNFQSNSLSGITTYLQWAHSQAQLTEAPGWLLGGAPVDQ